MKIPLRHADGRERHAVDSDSAANCVGRCSESAAPKRIGKDSDVRAAGPVVGGHQHAAQLGLDAEHHWTVTGEGQDADRFHLTVEFRGE